MRLLAFIAAIGFSWPAAVLAQSDAPVTKPEVKPGDRWTYRRVDLWNNAETTRYEMEVTFVGKDVIQAVNRRGSQEIDVSYTSEWNVVNDLDGGVWNPHSGMLKFPLQPGASYAAEAEITRPRQGAFRSKMEIPLKVVGWEEIVVPAGKFRALKIDGPGSYQRQDVSGAGQIHFVFWYVPEVKRWAKVTIESTDFRGQPFNRTAEELVEFKVQ